MVMETTLRADWRSRVLLGASGRVDVESFVSVDLWARPGVFFFSSWTGSGQDLDTRRGLATFPAALRTRLTRLPIGPERRPRVRRLIRSAGEDSRSRRVPRGLAPGPGGGRPDHPIQRESTKHEPKALAHNAPAPGRGVRRR